MNQQRQGASGDLEQHALHLTIFASLAIIVLAGGLALLMYPAVFANRESSPSKIPHIAFYGFLALSCLLVADSSASDPDGHRSQAVDGGFEAGERRFALHHAEFQYV